jgi:hypothetical protein
MPGAAFRERRTPTPTDYSFPFPGDKRSPRPEFLRKPSSGHTKWKRPIPFPMPPAGSEAAPRSSSRDPILRPSNSAARTFSPPNTAARTRRGTEPARLVESACAVPEETFIEEGDFESEVPYSDYSHEEIRNNRSKRSRIAHKERGSLRRTYRDDEPPQNRNSDTPLKSHAQIVKPKGKLKVLNETKREVFIPGIVSVGNLARILGVSLGKPRIIRKRSEHSLPC